VVLILTACAAVLLLVVGVAVSTSFKKRKEKRRVQTACASSDAAQTTFVALVSLANPRGAAATLLSIFERAHCPLRIYVGVIEIYGPADGASVLEEYESGVRFSRAPFCLKDHVRVIKIPLSEHRGIVSAYEQAERYLYKDEAFVCTMQPHTELAPQWEQHCIRALKQQAALNGSTVVVDNTVLSTVLAAAGSGQPAATAPGTYCGFGARGRLAAYRMRKLLDAVPTVPAVAWSSSFSFAPGRRVGAVPYDVLPDAEPAGLDASGHDMYMSLKLATRGWVVVHPAFSVGVVHRQAAKAVGSATWYSALLRAAGSTAAAEEPFYRPGVVPRITARAQLGLSPHPNPDEINVKLGSMGELYSMLSRIELRQQQQHVNPT
jgi:hypothetical protein